MKTFFAEFARQNPADFAPILDWIISSDGDFFPKSRHWNKTDVSHFTQSVGGMLVRTRIVHAATKDIPFPKRSAITPCIYIGQCDSFARDLLRHIRNSIAHGHAEFKRIKGKDMLELRDYGRSGLLSAYILMPADFPVSLYALYKQKGARKC